MRVAELSERLKVPYRDVRYVLEQGHLPKGVEESPGKGEHRELDPAQAFWLAIVLKLKQSGLRTPLAAAIADFAKTAVHGIARGLMWEHGFQPFQGHMKTDNQWYLDVGELKYIRVATTANPSVDGLDVMPWSVIGKSQTVRGVDPIVVIRVDLARLARVLHQ